MCAGDPYCEYVWKLKESTKLPGEHDPVSTKLKTPCESPKRGLSWELKYNFVMGTYSDFINGFHYAISKKYGAVEAVKMKERVDKIDDRVKRLTNSILKIFNIEGNDATTIGQVLDIWDELTETESIILERSKTIDRRKVTKCPWKTEPKDISDWTLSLLNIVAKTINPTATLERPKSMCEGDPYCKYIFKIKEFAQ